MHLASITGKTASVSYVLTPVVIHGKILCVQPAVFYVLMSGHRMVVLIVKQSVNTTLSIQDVQYAVSTAVTSGHRVNVQFVI